jgi:hypothetical protein
MRKFTLRHSINCSTDRFWEVFFDRDFNLTLFRDALGFPEFDIIEQTEKDDELVRVVRGRPKMNMPKAVMKLLGDSFGYEETGRLDRKTQQWSWTMKPNQLADKLHNSGRLWVEPAGDDKCTRIAEMESGAKIFGLGSLIEKSTEAEFRTGWDASAVFMNKWLADKS